MQNAALASGLPQEFCARLFTKEEIRIRQQSGDGPNLAQNLRRARVGDSQHQEGLMIGLHSPLTEREQSRARCVRYGVSVAQIFLLMMQRMKWKKMEWPMRNEDQTANR